MTAPAAPRLLLRRAASAPGREVDVLVVDGTIERIGSLVGPGPDGRHTVVVDLEGRPLLPGLVDHHLHLLGAAAAMGSVDCGPDALRAAGGLGAVLRRARSARPAGWLRAVDYDVDRSGPLDRWTLDAMGVGPVRVQDRTGILWVLDSVALDAVRPDHPSGWPEGVEQGEDGEPTGVLVRLDRWLRERLANPVPDLGPVGAALAAFGVTAVTDAGADNGPAELAVLAAAGLPQRVTAMTREAAVAFPAGIVAGPVKVLLDDDRLPGLEEVAARVAEAHAAGRAVAVHCVTDAQLVLALNAGIGAGDRIEHASFVPADLLPMLVEARCTAVVQPGLVRTRGDRYLAAHDRSEQEALHRLGTLLAAGVPVWGSSDAPYGPLDPWTGIAAAIDRTTAGGAVLNADDAVDPAVALALFTGGAVRVGAPADLVVLDDGWDRLGHHPEIAATLVAGAVVHASSRWTASAGLGG